MPVTEGLIRFESDGSISFGNYKLDKKSKLENFRHSGDSHGVKAFYEITKLERNGMFIYESVLGTAVEHFEATDWGVEFPMESDKGAQITVQPGDDVEYVIVVDSMSAGGMKVNMSGKLNASVGLNEGVPVQVRTVKREE